MFDTIQAVDSAHQTWSNVDMQGKVHTFRVRNLAILPDRGASGVHGALSVVEWDEPIPEGNAEAPYLEQMSYAMSLFEPCSCGHDCCGHVFSTGAVTVAPIKLDATRRSCMVEWHFHRNI